MDVLNIDYQSPQAAKDFSTSLKETGFAVLSNHPIDLKSIQTLYTEWKDFFNSSEKEQYHYIKPSQAGYFPFGTENAKGSQASDLKEFFQYYPNGPIPSHLKSSTKTMHEKLLSLAEELLQWIEQELPSSISQNLSMPLSNMIQNSEHTMLRILHYPPIPEDLPQDAIRAAAHEDINLITLIPAASAQGLEVQDINDNWHEVKCQSGNIVINVGDMLQMCTDGYYKSTTHRVINPQDVTAKQSRFSMPLFLHPQKHVKLSPKHTAESYLTERLKEIGIY